jgi:hypothetical protein
MLGNAVAYVLVVLSWAAALTRGLKATVYLVTEQAERLVVELDQSDKRELL